MVLDLQSIITEQEDAFQQKDARIDRLSQQYQQILEQYRLAQQRRFGQSSEVNLDQLGLLGAALFSVFFLL